MIFQGLWVGLQKVILTNERLLGSTGAGKPVFPFLSVLPHTRLVEIPKTFSEPEVALIPKADQ